MNDFYYNEVEQEHALVASVIELQDINKEVAKLLVRKEQLTDLIIGSLEHQHEGQKTYEYGEWRIEVKTPCVYSLNKKMYESGEFNIPLEFNPIRQSVSYTIDKKLCDKMMNEAPLDIRESLIELIEKKSGKASVTIREKC